jgi:HD-like signal output (HDOD) protein
VVDVAARLKAAVSEGLRQVQDSVPDGDRTTGLTDLLNALTDQSGGHVRQLPAAAQRALTACDDENVTNAALVALFERDPMLTEALLTRANSVYYNPSGRPCFSLAEAIVRQGRRSAHSVILQQVLGGMVCRPGGAWTNMVSQTWAHMVRTGPIARSIAPAFDVDPEQAMTLGLLHDVGKLVIFDRISALRSAARGELNLGERPVSRLLRVLHEPLGGLCALHWNLGDQAALAIAMHHRDPIPEKRNPLSEVIWLAERYDLAADRTESKKMEELWAAGQLTGRMKDAVAALDGLRDAAVQQSQAVRRAL